VPPVLHDGDREVDRVPHVAQARRRADAEIGTLHDARIQLDHAVGVEASADAGVQQRLVLHVADRRHHRRQRAVADPRPARVARALDGGLAVGAFVNGNRAGAAVDDERPADG